MKMLIPIHDRRIEYAARNIKEDTKSRVFDKDYQKNRKQERTSTLDAIEEENKKKNAFNSKEHLKYIP